MDVAQGWFQRIALAGGFSMAASVSASVVGLVVVTACSYQNGVSSCGVQCSPDGTCPSGLVCNAEKRCADNAGTACGLSVVDAFRQADAAQAEGDRYRYVVASMTLPSSTSQARILSLDLDDDGRNDNALGSVFALFKGQGLDVQPAVNDALNYGSYVQLVEFQTTSFVAASGAGLQMFFGDPMSFTPSACVDPNRPDTCGQHLKETGSFKILENSPRNSTLLGRVAFGTFSGGPGRLSVQMPFIFSVTPVQLDLIGARVVLSMINSSSLGRGIAQFHLRKSRTTRSSKRCLRLMLHVMQLDALPTALPTRCRLVSE